MSGSNVRSDYITDLTYVDHTKEENTRWCDKAQSLSMKHVGCCPDVTVQRLQTVVPSPASLVSLT